MKIYKYMNQPTSKNYTLQPLVLSCTAVQNMLRRFVFMCVYTLEAALDLSTRQTPPPRLETICTEQL